MITLAAPAWLLGWLLVPALWYLHRSGQILRRHPVANLELWRDSRERAVQAGERRPPDPAWLRRAAILALLCLALAGPQWRRSAEPVTVWVDDSLSMQTLEDGTSRLERGLRLAQAALRETGTVDAIFRPLSEPTRSYPAAAPGTLRAMLLRAVEEEPRPPPSDALDPTRANWLITDGADERVNAWASRSAVGRVIQVATTTRNVGISRVTVRPQPGHPTAHAIQVVVRNGGAVRETRSLEVSFDSDAPVTTHVTVDAGASTAVTIPAARPVQRVTARLVPTDALVQDDVAVVDTSPLAPLAVHVDTHCPASVTRSVAAHPALQATRGDDARLVIDCGSGWGRNLPVPRVVLHPGPPRSFDRAALVWVASVPIGQRQFIDSLPPIALGPLDAARPTDAVLLAAGENPLVILRAGPARLVETSLDLGSTEAAASDAAPLTLAFLVDLALDSPLLDRSVAFVRSDSASMVVARTVLVTHPRAQRTARGDGVSLLLPFLLPVLVLLLWEALALARRLLRDLGLSGRSVA